MTAPDRGPETARTPPPERTAAPPDRGPESERTLAPERTTLHVRDG